LRGQRAVGRPHGHRQPVLAGRARQAERLPCGEAGYVPVCRHNLEPGRVRVAGSEGQREPIVISHAGADQAEVRRGLIAAGGKSFAWDDGRAFHDRDVGPVAPGELAGHRRSVEEAKPRGGVLGDEVVAGAIELRLIPGLPERDARGQCAGSARPGGTALITQRCLFNACGPGGRGWRAGGRRLPAEHPA
jgi:hypothetical protein